MTAPLGGAMGKRKMTQAEYDAGRSNWMASGGTEKEAASAQYNASPAMATYRGQLAQAARPTAGVQQTQIDPTNDLRSKQITPGYDPRLASTQRQATGAQNAVAGWSGYTPFQSVNSQDAYTSQAGGYLNQAAQAGQAAPIAGTNLTGARGYLSQAATAAGGGGAAYTGPTAIQYGDDTTGLRSQLTSQLGGLSSAPDRTSLAQQAYELMRQKDAPTRDAERRALGARQVALGRQGAGMTTTALNDLESEFARSDAETQRDLALQAAGDTLSDRLNVTGAIQSGYGTLAGQDTTSAGFTADAARAKLGADQFNSDAGFQRANLLRGVAGDEAGFAQIGRRDAESDRSYGLERGRFMGDLSNQAFDQGSSLRDEARTERGDRMAFDQADLNAKRGIFGDLASRESTLFDQGQRTRDEFRGERDFQAGQAQQGIDNAFRQTALEESLLGGQFGRDMTELGTYNDLGWGYDPTGLYGDQAAGYDQQAGEAWGGVGDALGSLGQTLGQRSPTGMSVSDASNILDYQPKVTPAKLSPSRLR